MELHMVPAHGQVVPDRCHPVTEAPVDSTVRRPKGSYRLLLSQDFVEMGPHHSSKQTLTAVAWRYRDDRGSTAPDRPPRDGHVEGEGGSGAHHRGAVETDHRPL